MSANVEITLIVADGSEHKVSKEIMHSKTIDDLIHGLENTDDIRIPLPNIGSEIKEVIEFCKHINDEKWRSTFTSSFLDNDSVMTEKELFNKHQELFKITMAANYLHIKPLLDTCCKTIADMIRGKTTDEMRKILNIEHLPKVEEKDQVKVEKA